MTPSAAASLQPEVTDYLQAWARSLSQVMGQITAAPVLCAPLGTMPEGLLAAGPGDFWILCACSGGLRGEMSFRLVSTSVLRLAQIFTSEPAVPEAELTEEHRGAVVELLRQVAGVVATSFKMRGGEIQFRLDSAPSPTSWPASSTTWLRVGEEGTSSALLELHVSAALVAGLRADQAEVAGATKGPPPSPNPVPLPSSTAQGDESKLEMLMDVELAMTLRFGGRQLLLREILDLTPGTVIELDRQVKDAVDVLLDGRLVARGEVVVVDGNYGLRVTEVVSAGGI
jgi:flagellar motor switch protein FliN